MNINSVSNINFGKVLAVVGSKNQIDELEQKLKDEQLKPNEDYILEHSDTSSKKNLIRQKRIKENQNVAFLVTRSDVKKVLWEDPGWSSHQIGTHSEKYFDLNDAKNSKDILSAVKLDRYC